MKDFLRLIANLRWPRSPGHACVHALIAAAIMWAFAAIVLFVGSSDRGVLGPLRGTDFVQFYAMGLVAASGETATLYDARARHELQGNSVPESRGDFYPPVYPPQTAVLFAPLSGLRYQHALWLWTLITLAIYALVIRFEWHAAEWPVDGAFVLAAAAAFPPVWNLVLHGQLTIVILLAFWLGAIALANDRRFLAGVAFGLLAFKPQFGIPLAAVVLACREWRLLGGALVCVAGQIVVTAVALGWSAIAAFVRAVPVIVEYADFLEPKAFQSHSLRAMTRIVPNEIGIPLWLVLIAIVLALTVLGWNSARSARVRVGMVVMASVLVNPHLIVYDGSVLALPLMWFTARSFSRLAHSPTYWYAMYWLFATFLAPTAALIPGVQISVVLLAWMFVYVGRRVRLAAELQPPIAVAA